MSGNYPDGISQSDIDRAHDGGDEPQLDEATCEYCGEPAGELIEIDDSDPSVGYRSTLAVCGSCLTRIRLQKARGY
jgi:hypothetical protein